MEKGTFKQYVQLNIKTIGEAIMYMTSTAPETWPVTPEKFDDLMKMVTVISKQKSIYEHLTIMIIKLFHLVMNYNPTASEEVRNKYKENIQDMIDLVVSTIRKC